MYNNYMLFSSITFIYIFLPWLFICYFAVRSIPYKNAILLVFSLFFYAYGEPIYVFLLIFIAFLNYFIALCINKSKYTKMLKKGLFFLIIGIDICFILFFKYINLLIDTFNLLTNKNIANLNVALPLGISFFTFQIISYVADVFKGEVKIQKSFPKFLLYISFFPQLIAGPIIKYKDIEHQLDMRDINNENFIKGAYNFSIGLAKKVIVANVLGNVADTMLHMNGENISVLTSWYGIFIFSLQFYLDFSGYSDMAIGLSKMFGFTFPENFNYPYIATSITDFWKRWHISLSSFFREYVYIPLGGKYRHQIRNLFIVWFLTGLWHGANYNFIIWGLYYFVFLVIEKFILDKIFKFLPIFIKNFFGFIFTIFIVMIANTIFYFTNLSELINHLKIMLFINKNPITNMYVISSFRENFFLIIFAIIICTPILKIIKNKIFKNKNIVSYNNAKINNSINNNLKIQKAKNKSFTDLNIYSNFEMIFDTCVIIILMSLSTFELLGQSYNPFLYFRF